MGLFGKKKKEFVDLTSNSRNYSAPVNENVTQTIQTPESKTSLMFPGDFSQASDQFPQNTQTNSSSEYMDVSESVEERRKRLTKRLLDMTNKIEDLSNQIYHLQQRLEVLERKIGANSFE
jgi:hypothetical protein